MYFPENISENYLSVWSLENVTISRLSSGVFLQPNSRITSLCPKKLWTGKSRCLWFQRNSEWSFLWFWGTITVANLDKKNIFNNFVYNQRKLIIIIILLPIAKWSVHGLPNRDGSFECGQRFGCLLWICKKNI